MSIESAFVDLLHHYGAGVIGVSVAADSLGLPVPGESALVAGAVAAGRGAISLQGVVLAGLLGAILGDNIGYLIGRRYGRTAILRYGGRVGITPARYERVTGIALRYGPLMVVIGRFVVLLRQLNGLVAGSTGMPWARFLLANVLGSLIWVGFWTFVAFKLGKDHHILPQVSHLVARAVWVLLPVTLFALIWLARRQKAQGSGPRRDGDG